MTHLDDMPRRSSGAAKKWTLRAGLLVVAIAAVKLAVVALVAMNFLPT